MESIDNRYVLISGLKEMVLVGIIALHLNLI